MSVGDETIIDTVTVVITPGDDPPEVSNDNITIDEDESSENIIIVDIDGDPIEGYSFTTGNSGGGVAFYDTMNNKNISFQYENSSSSEDDRLGEIIDNGDLTFKYVPADNKFGDDNLKLVINGYGYNKKVV